MARLIVCSAVVRLSYRLSGAASWNCILVPGVTVNVPAVCPYCAWRPVIIGLPGWNAFVFTATLRPFTETDVNSTVSGSFLRGLERDDATFPNTLLPAFNTTLPLIETSCASFASKVLPTAAREEN